MAGFNHFGQVSEELDILLSQIVRKAAFDVQAQAASNAAVDTGFLRNSIYTVTTEGSTYGRAGSAPGDATLLPEVPGPGDKHTAYVAVGASYGAYVNYGTRYQPAQPFWEPAIDAVVPSLNAALEAIESQLR